ncbi:hypothetical protein VHEMI08243 [[Torrubiella] hemipterigena]|uniref:Fe2OG dioxygenase domain-containing protein n=1 Tax=[Torrubiella] hemipterigena TaxID=1531966 RepID=A0A0A1TPD4_9HYPO|nr:hypothetical protein VHEMI08243 [[Torrubiella] hemipterigena]
MPSTIYEPIIDRRRPSGKVPSAKFDPERHLAFEEPVSTLTWQDLGYPKDHGVSPIAVAQPFRLFTDEAIQYMRNEILQVEVMEKFRVSSTIAAMQVRGYVETHAPFIYAAWKHPKTLEILSQVMGIDLSIKVDHEIGHVNFAVKSEALETDIDIQTGDSRYPGADATTGTKYDAEKEVVGWHYDSYPFSCVTMLSDSTNMVGGETAVQLGDSKGILKLAQPRLGYATLLQGRYVLHKGLTAGPGRERLSMVTSLWPRSAFVRDESFLTNIRTVSNNSQLYVQFAEYRLAMLEERTRAQLENIKRCRDKGDQIDMTALKTFIADQQEHLRITDLALLEENMIERGIVKEIAVENEAVDAT